MNDLSYWFPKLRDAGIPVPRTEIVKTDVELWRLLDGGTPDGYAEFLKQLHAAAGRVGPYPVFLRTGHLAAKHDWKDTCFVPDVSALPSHVARLAEESELVDMLGLPYDEWVVREMLKPLTTFEAFSGRMPISREVRFFIEAGEIVCQHPYWPEGAIAEEHVWTSTTDWRERLRKLNELTPEDNERVRALAHRIAQVFADDGAWSADLFYDVERDEWFCTDMALASRSFHWAGCPEAHRFERQKGEPL